MIYILILSDKRKQGGGVGLNYSRRPASQSARIHGRQAMYRSAPYPRTRIGRIIRDIQLSEEIFK